MTSPLDWSLVRGGLPIVVGVTAAAGMAMLLYRAGRGRIRWGLVACGSAVALSTAGGWYVDNVWRPFPDHLPAEVLGWVAFGLAGAGLAVVCWPGTGWRLRGVAVLAAAATLLGSGLAINGLYGQYSTVRAALGLRPANKIRLEDVEPHARHSVEPVPDRPLAAVWRRPAYLPASGRLLSAPIPGEKSGFSARPAWVYLPPAYLATERAVLPVLVLLSGQPGSTRDWLDGGQVDQVMDRFAREHDGLAPLVVMPDALGSTMANPLCLDSRLGNVETYLTEDVPSWIRSHFEVDPDVRHWAVGGFSYGGTCALQLGVRRPDRYRTLLDLSGQSEPTLGDRAMTVSAAFGGDAAAFTRVNPLDILATQRFPTTTMLMVVGRDDGEYGPQQRAVRAACERAGMTVQWWEPPGGHNWQVWGPGLVAALPQLAARIGLIAG
ncbi:alpha/beta hydrolase-fold protein [Dactylosporangium sp. NPDC000555]|uniref:alpha/beta hydrolase n=1 Tax=Dactylosporangium sp. NPDC000555 TaxID=3154260 RepID=UPI00331BDAE6